MIILILHFFFHLSRNYFRAYITNEIIQDIIESVTRRVNVIQLRLYLHQLEKELNI